MYFCFKISTPNKLAYIFTGCNQRELEAFLNQLLGISLSKGPIHLPTPIIFYYSKLCQSKKLENTQSGQGKEFNEESFFKGISKKTLDIDQILGFNGFEHKDLFGKGSDKLFFVKKNGKLASMDVFDSNPIFGFDQ